MRALIVAQAVEGEKAFQLQSERYRQLTQPQQQQQSHPKTANTAPTSSNAVVPNAQQSKKQSEISVKNENKISGTVPAAAAVATTFQTPVPTTSASAPTLPKERLRPLLEKAFNFLVNEDKEKIFLHRVRKKSLKLCLYEFGVD